MHLKSHALASASFLLESKACQLSAYGAPLTHQPGKAGSPVVAPEMEGRCWGKEGQLIPEIGSGRIAWKQLVPEKVNS